MLVPNEVRISVENKKAASENGDVDVITVDVTVVHVDVVAIDVWHRIPG
jgi:hypothetical protein